MHRHRHASPGDGSTGARYIMVEDRDGDTQPRCLRHLPGRRVAERQDRRTDPGFAQRPRFTERCDCQSDGAASQRRARRTHRTMTIRIRLEHRHHGHAGN